MTQKAHTVDADEVKDIENRLSNTEIGILHFLEEERPSAAKHDDTLRVVPFCPFVRANVRGVLENICQSSL